jgi:glycosyltransferase involved in cell wall biosynthesis/predicted GH43/DUF377 family glycosyl hydrolase
MIVRDEVAVIERCLRSVLPIIDTWVICDTGSADGTPEQISSVLNGFPGTLHHSDWCDFGANRSELMELARGAADYLLLLDADMTLRIEGPLPPLTADAYLLRHLGDLEYAVPRLVRGERRWWYEGSTHEFLATEGEFAQEVLDALAVEHHGDGSSRARKLERDRRLLERDLERDPTDARAHFYLAQTYRDLGQRRRAIDLYRQRAELGGWDEEVFYALYQAGVLLAEEGDESAVAVLLDAWEERPTRAEPLHELARLSRSRARYRAAYTFASQGLEIPRPDDVLFVHRDIYDWGLLFELSIAAYWVGRIEEALAANDRLLAEGFIPGSIEEYVHVNRDYCLEALGRPLGRAPRGSPESPGVPLVDLARSLEIDELRLEVLPAWPRFNPSIAEDGDGYRLVVRTANYELRNGRYEFLTDDGIIKTLNYVAELDSALHVRNVSPIGDGAGGPPRYPSRVQGYEDCRLIQLGGCWFATATVRDRNPDERCEIVLLELDGTEIAGVSILTGPAPFQHQKNWMPFVMGAELGFVYGCAPTIVLRLDRSTGTVDEIARNPAPRYAADLRGGSQGLWVGDGFLFVVHEVWPEDRGRSYTHRFVLLDESYRLTGISPRFRFVSRGVEFCAGLARRGDDLLLSFGVGDRAACLAVVDKDEALGLLDPVRARLRGLTTGRGWS